MTSILPENMTAENKSANYVANFFKEHKIGRIHSVNHVKTFVPPGKNSIKTGIINYYLWLSNGNLFIIEILIN